MTVFTRLLDDGIRLPAATGSLLGPPDDEFLCRFVHRGSDADAQLTLHLPQADASVQQARPPGT